MSLCGGINMKNPTMQAPQITTSTGKTGMPGSLKEAMWGGLSLHKAMGTAAAAVSLHKATNGLSKGKDNPERSQSKPPYKSPHEPAKAAPKADAYQHMYRGQGARSKRTARRALQAAGLEVPSSLKPGKAVNDLPEPEKAEAKALQKRLKELRFSNRFSTSEVEWEVSQVKARLHELLGPGDGDEEDEEEDELAKAEQVNKELQHAIEMAKTLTGALNQQCNETPVKEEPEKAKGAEANTAQPAEATTTQPVEATQVEPAKANGSLPTGDTEESEEEEEEWQKVGEKKNKKKKAKKTKKNP